MVYDYVFHLGYRGWPMETNLALSTWKLTHDLVLGATGARHFNPVSVAQRAFPNRGSFDLDRPWITVPPSTGVFQTEGIAVGISEEWIELKMGLLWALLRYRLGATHCLLRPQGGRFEEWFGADVVPIPRFLHGGHSWEEAAAVISGASTFLGDCSALHVLAVALGTPVILMEPQEMRWNPIFYPLGKVGPQVTLVTGGDGRPTFDARHVRDALECATLSRKATTS